MVRALFADFDCTAIYMHARGRRNPFQQEYQMRAGNIALAVSGASRRGAFRCMRSVAAIRAQIRGL